PMSSRRMSMWPVTSSAPRWSIFRPSTWLKRMRCSKMSLSFSTNSGSKACALAVLMFLLIGKLAAFGWERLLRSCESDQGLLRCHLLAEFDMQAGDAGRARRGDGVFELHGFDHEQRVAGRDLLAG